jgi:hypothetical protein
LDDKLLEDQEAVRTLRDILIPHGRALEAGEPLVSPEFRKKIEGSKHYNYHISSAAKASNSLRDFLNEVIIDQDAGIVPKAL